jgi:peptidoglycan/LPS O-acetylase OafA/YrhL
MKYRPEIDGLRAVAVAPVILFHAGAQQISGGFLGVDLFFVISGFLITGIISREMRDGRFSFGAFYKRRARRILPMLLVVIACSAPFAWLFMSRGEVLVFGRSAIYVLLFVSNFFFFKQSSYFDHSAETSPLLHTWSLGVEEQYYILFPLLMLLLWRKAPRSIAPALAGLLAASLLLCIACARAYPDFTFYLPLTRAWELLAGALCALAPSRPFAKPGAWLSAGGLAAIVLSLFVVDQAMPWPSAITLAPVCGACLILLYARAGTPVARLLSSAPLRGLGLISYSAYLWHQPVFAFARIQNFGEPGALVMTGLCVAVVLLSILSWRYVEQPWRDGRIHAFAPQRLAQTFGVALLALGAGGALAGALTQGFTNIRSKGQEALLAYNESAYKQAIDRAMGPCFLQTRSGATSAPAACLQGGDELLVWGDSHAAILSLGLRERGEKPAQMTAGACPPALGFDSAEAPACRSLNDANFAAITKLQPAQLILHAYWSHYDAALLTPKLRATIAEIQRAAPRARILLVGGVPTWRPNLPLHMLSLRQEIAPGLELQNRNLPEVRAFDARLRDIAEATHVAFTAPTDLLCGETACRAVVPDGAGQTLSAFDDAHLTPPAALLLARSLPLPSHADAPPPAR